MFTQGTLTRVANSSSSGTGARIVLDGRLGCAGGTDHLTIDRLVEDSIEAARFGPQVGALQLPGPSPVGPEPGGAFCDETAGLTAADLVLVGREVIAAVHSARGDVVVDATVTRTVVDEVLANTAGLIYVRPSTRFSVSVTAKRNRDGDLVSSVAACSATRRSAARVQPVGLAQEVVDQLARCDTSASISTGEYPVVLSGEAVAGLLYPLLLALDGSSLARGVSPLARTRKTLRLSSSLHLYSDPFVQSAPASYARDGDGYAARQVDFIRDGLLVEGMFDAATAARWGIRFPDAREWARPGCGARAATSGATTPSAAVLTLAPGGSRNLLDGIDRGLYVESLLGVRMGNPIGGEFSNSVHIGSLIERGQLVGRVKNTMLAGDVYAALANVAGVGARATWVGGDALLPDIRIDGMRVISKGAT